MSVLLEDLVRSIELWLKLLKKPEPYVDPNLDPVLLVPGIAGSILQAVDEKGKEERVWVRIFGSDREFCTKLWSRFDPKSDAAEEDEPPSKSTKDKKANGPDAGKPNLVFKITNKVAYKTVLKAHSAVVLKAESMTDKVEWLNKLRNVIGGKGGQVKGDNGTPMRQSLSDGSLGNMCH